MIEEQKYLSYTIDMFNEIIDDSNFKLGNLKNLYKHDYDAMLEEKDKLLKKVNSIEKAKNKPYFARIDFESNNHYDKCYIGKIGVMDYDNKIITVDWRAPIANLYYDANIGICSYNSPGGIIEGNLILKRQFEIEDEKLINFNDVDTVSNDELLKPYLNVSADKRLKNIVSTIQSEQNKIIREKINKNIIVQGVAGSGKTTVALHRIAYLVYNTRDYLKPSDYMVIGPNKFFVNYISAILPDLDVDGVAEYTLEEVFEKYLNDDYVINNSLDKIVEEDFVSNYKTSMNIKKDIDEYFNQLEIIPDSNLTIKGESIISKTVIKTLFSKIDNNIYKSIKAKIDHLIILINKYYQDNQESILANLIKRKVNKQIINQVKTNLNYHLKKHFDIVKKKVNDIYISILNKINIDTKNINKNMIDIEDIPSLLYIKYLLIGDNIFDNYKHIVIDEAQDYGEFTFYVIKQIFKNSTFSIYGDLAQSLYSYRSINSWESLNKIFTNIEILKLNKSYRTTIEIMNEANKINNLLHFDEAIPVIRHGEIVEYTNKEIIELINNLQNNYKTIAIITKDPKESFELYNSIKERIKINLISSSNLSYESNINILPSYLSKGLEFDAVIILDTFDKDKQLDMKLLYVSMTRALHKLYIKK